MKKMENIIWIIIYLKENKNIYSKRFLSKKFKIDLRNYDLSDFIVISEKKNNIEWYKRRHKITLKSWYKKHLNRLIKKK